MTIEKRELELFLHLKKKTKRPNKIEGTNKRSKGSKLKIRDKSTSALKNDIEPFEPSLQTEFGPDMGLPIKELTAIVRLLSTIQVNCLL